MYEKFYGLTRNPFLMTPDPEYLYFTRAHREALAGLGYAIVARKGFVVLTGGAGTGKTTLVHKVMASMPASKASICLMLNPTLSPAEFLESVLLDFGIAEVRPSKAQRLAALLGFLAQKHSEGNTAVLVVDEAHKLTEELLEEIRLLTNFEVPEGKLLQIVLVGQEELRSILNRESLQQLKQRIALHLTIEPLPPEEVGLYVEHRWCKSGASTRHPFSSDALLAIARWSRGIPRLVHSLCDNALLLAFADGAASVEAAHVTQAAGDLALTRPSGGRATRPPEAPASAPSPGSEARGGPESEPGAVTTGISTLDRYISKRQGVNGHSGRNGAGRESSGIPTLDRYLSKRQGK